MIKSFFFSFSLLLTEHLRRPAPPVFLTTLSPVTVHTMAPAYSKMAMGQAAAPAVQARQLDAAVPSAAERVNRVS